MNATLKEAKHAMKTFLKVFKITKFSGKQKLFYDWLLKNGETFTEILPVVRFGKMGECYYNAQMYAIGKPKVKYYEGWAVTEHLCLPLEHGFTVINGKVYDPTWKDGLVYFGVHIPTNFVMEHILDTSMSESLLGKWGIEQVERKCGTPMQLSRN